MATVSFDIDALSKRARRLRKAFARGLGHKATALQAVALNDAAVATAKAELAAVDPAVTHNDFVRLSGEARRARTEMVAALASERQISTTAFDQYIQARQAQK